MNLPALQLKKAIENLPNPESFPHPIFKVSLLNGPEPLPVSYQGGYAPDIEDSIAVVEVQFVKNEFTRQWDLQGISNVVSIMPGLETYSRKVSSDGHLYDLEIEMFHQILFKLLKRVPMPDEVLLLEKKIVPKTGDRKMDVFFLGSKLGTIEYMPNAMEFKPSKLYRK